MSTVPYISSNTTQATAQNQQGTSANQALNTYTPGQQGVQGQLGSLYQSLLGGNIPSSFTNPQAATQAYQNNFQQQVAPGIAANLGAGSPAIASQNALGLSQLQGQLYNTGVSNYMNALGQGSNYALGMPVGASNAGQTASTGTQTSQSNNTQGINSLAFLANLLGGISQQ